MFNDTAVDRDTAGLDSGIGDCSPAVDKERRACGRRLRKMRIGDPVIYKGRRYVLRGLEPMSMPDRRADLEDAETGELIRAPVAELEPA